MAQATAMLTGEQLSRLRAAFDGEIVTTADDGYDEARRLWNAVHDRRPAVIVRLTTIAKAATAIRFAWRPGLSSSPSDPAATAARVIPVGTAASWWTCRGCGA